MLGRMGNEVVVLTENNGRVKTESEQNFTVYPLKGLLTRISTRFSMANKAISFQSGFFSPDIIQDAAKRLSKNVQPDVIYSCGTSFSSVFSAMLGYVTGIPTVHYVFEYSGAWNWWRGDINTMQGYDVPLRYVIRQFVNTMPRELIRRDFLHKWALGKITKLVACSDHVKKALNHFVSGISDVSIVYPGVKIPLSPNNSIEKDAEVITYLGHLWQGRGVLDLTLAFSLVIKRHPRAKLIMASTNIHPLTEYYFEKIIEKNGLRQSVLRMGVVEDSYRKLLLPSSVIVLPYRDTPSMKLLESMAAAKPVITTRVGWTHELISDGVNGFLTNIGDVKKIAERLELLLGNPELGEEIGKSARAIIEEKCTLNRNATNLLEILKEASYKGLD